MDKTNWLEQFNINVKTVTKGQIEQMLDALITFQMEGVSDEACSKSLDAICDVCNMDWTDIEDIIIS